MRAPLLALAIVAVIALTPALPRAEPGGSVTLAVPDRSNTAPWLASSGSFVAVAWGASASGQADVMVAISRDAGQTFGSPVRVNRVPGEARLNGEIAPRVALSAVSAGAVPALTVLWNAKDGGTQIKTARSADGGVTFDAPVSLQAPGAAGDRGWQALAMDANGVAHAIWLDHRGLAAGKSASGGMSHKGEHDGVAMAQKSGLYYASTASVKTAERELFKGVCYCCKTALAIGPGGQLYAAWRHVFAGNFRDMGFTMSRDGGRSFSPLVRVNEDGWSINGCPDDGPAMAVDAAGTVHLVWPTVVGGTEGAILYASSRDGRSFSAPVRVPTLGGPKPSHPQIVVEAPGRVAVAWDESVNGRRVAVVRRATSNGTGAKFGDAIMLSENASTYPVLAVSNGTALAAWATGGERSAIHIQRLPN